MKQELFDLVKQLSMLSDYAVFLKPRDENLLAFNDRAAKLLIIDAISDKLSKYSTDFDTENLLIGNYSFRKYTLKPLDSVIVVGFSQEIFDKDSTDIFLQIIENSSDGIIILKDTKVVFANKRARDIFDVPFEAEIENAYEYVLNKDVVSILKRNYNARMKGDPIEEEYEVCMVSKTGRKLWIRVMAHRIVFNGFPASLVFLRDLTEKKNAENKLLKSEQKLRSIYNAIPMPTYLWEKRGDDIILADSNQAGYEITKGGIKEYLNKSVDVVHDHTPDVAKQIKYCMANKTSFSEEKGYFLKSIKDHRYMRVKYVYIPDNQVLVHTDDITEHREAERLRKELEVKMFEASKMATLGEMATGIAHEINQPLAYIKLMLELLDENISFNNIDKNKIHKNIKDALSSTHRITRIINNLRIYGHSFDNENNAVDLIAPLENALLLLDEKIQNCQICVENNIQKLPLVLANEGRIEQVFINLINNAIDALNNISNTNKIVISGERDVYNVYIHVRNNGPKIHKELLDKIFDPFFTTKAVGKGTGLGLSISSSIVREFGGNITCISTDDQTTFTVKLNIL